MSLKIKSVRSLSQLAMVALLIFAVSATSHRLKSDVGTSANVQSENWQPTSPGSGGHYVGNKVCASCHPDESATQPSTSMAQTMSPAGHCQVLQSHQDLRVRLGHYSYLIIRKDDSVAYIVSDGRRSITESLLWAVGQGVGGQSYIYKRDGTFYESRVSYYSKIDGLDLTLGHPPAEPATLDAAAGRPLSEAGVLRCFACHSTDAVGESGLQLENMMPGITCEKCHGPGEKHVTAIKSGRLNNLHIFNPGRLKLRVLVYDFCGSCHRNAFDVADDNESGIATVRFEPYRLVLSRCFDSRDPRISCLACHNPHNHLQRSAAFYDSKCLACHAGGPRRSASTGVLIAAKCPVGTRNCVTCHMPKYELPGDHFSFTDHDIRIVRPNASYPG